MTAHKQAHESTARLAAIVESSHDAILGLELDGTITSWNRGAETMYGYAASEAIGQHISLVVPTSHLDEAREVIDQVARGQLVSVLETVRRRRDGALIDVAMSASPIRDKSNVVVGAASMTWDITQRKRADKTLKQYALELERSNQELEQFAYVASHDLKEPLRMVASYTNLLAEEYEERLDLKAGKYIQYAADGARRMSALIDDLLDYSRVGRTDEPFEATPLDVVLQHVLDDLRACIEESDARVEVTDQLPAVRGNPTRLRQLFQNLIGNALKFRHPDRRADVRIGCQQRGNMWELSVQDNGIGIDPEFHERIFQVFQRLHTVDEYPGTGIGLALCKKIVEQHGGEIRVSSDASQGTVFRFTLPILQPDGKMVATRRKIAARTAELESCSA
jgi:PAS domain S-box-containing protein